jgi:hypothetical protein
VKAPCCVSIVGSNLYTLHEIRNDIFFWWFGAIYEQKEDLLFLDCRCVLQTLAGKVISKLTS